MPAKNFFAGILARSLSPLTPATTITVHAYCRRLDGIEPQYRFGSTTVFDAIGERTHQTQTETAND